MKSLILILTLLFSTSAHCAKEEKIFHVYGALGEIYGPASYRAGTSSWEAGLLNRRSIGFAFLEYNGSAYVAYGPILGLELSPGAFAGLGWEWTFFGFSSIRIEANTGHTLDNYSSSEVHLGLSLFW